MESFNKDSSLSLDDGDDDENPKKTEETTVQAPSEIGNDGEKPCCSKTLRPQHNVRFLCDGDDTDIKEENHKSDAATKKEFIPKSHITPPISNVGAPPALTSDIHRQESIVHSDQFLPPRLLLGFSDSVLALPNLSEYDESRVKSGENEIEPQTLDQKLQHDNEILNDDISRKPPKTNLVPQLDSDNDENRIVNDGVKEIDEMDENNNPILWPTDSEKKLIKHASYIFHKDRRAELERLTKLMPRGREYVLFNVFTDFARYFGYRGSAKKKHVAFPEEFLEKYEQQGDVAGKDRFVPASKQSYMGIQMTSKKRKLSAVYSSWTVKSSEFAPRVERVDDINKCEFCCEKFCISCDCCRQPGKPEDIITCMNGYLADLNMASIFLHGHTTRTFESAMSNMEFIKFHESLVSVVAPTPWSINYSKQRLGTLSGSIWIFTYCIRTIIQQARQMDAIENTKSLPSEASFRKIMEQYATLCLTLSENVKIILQYNHNFYNFCKECIRILKVLQVHLGFQREIQLKPPIRRGDGLDLNKKLGQKDIVKLKGVEILVAKNKSSHDLEEDEPLEWNHFAELSGHEKAASLRHLLHVTTEGMNMVQTQLRFLLDDIVDSVKDTTEADLLFLLADMYDRIKFLESAGIRKLKPELEQISRTTSEFCNDFQSFIGYGQHIMKRFIEFRDMIHLSYEFFVEGLNLESVSEMVPATTFNRKRKLGCCGGESGRTGNIKKKIDKYQPKYQAIDFFRVYYMDAVNSRAEIYANKYQFHIDASKVQIVDMIPKGTYNVWGEVELVSPRLSFEEYVDPDEDDEDDDIGGGDKEKDVLPIKPILVITEGVGSKPTVDDEVSVAAAASSGIEDKGKAEPEVTASASKDSNRRSDDSTEEKNQMNK